MSNDSFPGFESDEAKPAAKPSAPASPPAGKPATGALGAKAGKAPKPEPGLAKEGAAPPPLAGASGPVQFEFESSDEPPASPRRHAPPPPAPEPSATPPRGAERVAAPPPAVDEDPDVKPGARKDLWTCPHCGTGNRPGRETCRACGKRPDEPVVVPWQKNPLILIPAIVVAVALLIGLIVLLSGTDVSQHPADVAHLDTKLRRGGAGNPHQIGGKTLEHPRACALVARCLLAQPDTRFTGSIEVVALLAPEARDADAASHLNPQIDGDSVTVPEAEHFLVLHLTGDLPKLTKGQIFSLTGDAGTFDGVTLPDNEYYIAVAQCDVGG